jgi:hypothetical protein
MSGNRLTIFDTTLRDGEQAPGFSLKIDEKLALARQLRSLGVDIIEAGFPIASDSDAEAVRLVAAQVQGPVIAALARCAAKDIERAAWALAPAPRRRIHDYGQVGDEFGALAGALASRLDPAAVHLEQLLHEREADSQSALRLFERMVHLREHVEDARQRFGRNPDARVAHRHHDFTVLSRHGEPDLAAAIQPEGARDLATADLPACHAFGFDEVEDRLAARLRRGR